MKRFLLTFFSLILTANTAFSVEIVYPKRNPVTINANSTFFIGSANIDEILKINDIEAKVYPNGSFAQFVPLVEGVNNFDITTTKDNVSDVLKFVINRPVKITSTKLPPELIEYPEKIYSKVKCDNTPLRATPIDSGINRISHLPKNLTLKINGEKGIFYRVYLNSTTNAWILKNDVEQAEQSNEVELIEIKTEKKDGFENIIFEVSEIPLFTIKEDEKKLTLKLYHISNKKDDDNTVTFDFKSNQPLTGYEVIPENKKLILKIRDPLIIDKNNPLKDIAIVIDAGHGGAEYGAVGGCGHKEKDINLEISKKLETELENNGSKVFMTRKTDTAVSLAERVKFIKNKNAVIAVSIHANAIPDGVDPMKKQGTSVYYYNNQAKSLAQNILTSMVTQLNTQDDKIRQASLALVRPTSAVSVLIEVGYIINPEDYQLLLDPIFQQNCANAITEGIKNYLINLNK